MIVVADLNLLLNAPVRAARKRHQIGGKHGSGVYQRIIGEIPFHRVYIEAFLGAGAVMLEKAPASVSYGVDLDPDVIARWCGGVDPNLSSGGVDPNLFSGGVDPNLSSGDGDVLNLSLVNEDAMSWLAHYSFAGDEFVYADPPYLSSVRSCQDRYYRFEMGDVESHVRLLELLDRLPCAVAISGYWSELYASMLDDWRSISFLARTRRGSRREFLWMNYPQPALLHDFRYVGLTFRARERLRKFQRRMPRLSM